jgi:hypothetical protein
MTETSQASQQTYYENQHEVQDFEPVEVSAPTPELPEPSPTPVPPVPAHKITTTETRDEIRRAVITLRQNSAVNQPGTFINDALQILEKLLADIEALLPK